MQKTTRRFAAFIVFVALLTACELPQPTPTATPSDPPATATEPLNTPTPIIVTRVAVSPTPDTSMPTPTIEHCENVPIEYEVLVAFLNIRIGPGTEYEITGNLEQGDRFEGTLCSDPDARMTYQWVQINQDNHPSNGGWVVWYSHETGKRYLR